MISYLNLYYALMGMSTTNWVRKIRKATKLICFMDPSQQMNDIEGFFFKHKEDLQNEITADFKKVVKSGKRLLPKDEHQLDSPFYFWLDKLKYGASCHFS